MEQRLQNELLNLDAKKIFDKYQAGSQDKQTSQ
jgi:hypothetical protein